MRIETIYFAGGCFWGLEHAFSYLNGVKETTVGYANSVVEQPSYQQVCAGGTQARECVKIDFDADICPLERLLDALFICIDPTQADGQGHDHGEQYRTGVYYTNPAHLPVLEAYFAKVKEKYTSFDTQLAPLQNFFDAEEYHQDYLYKNPTGYCHINLQQFAAVKNLNQD